MSRARWRTSLSGALVVALTAGSLVVPASASAGSRLFTWTGKASKFGDPRWSNPGNWQHGRVPFVGTTRPVDLVFPSLPCQVNRPSCTRAENDLGPVNIGTLTIAATGYPVGHAHGLGWQLYGAPVTIGDVSATVDASPGEIVQPSVLGFSTITLAPDPHTWSIDGGAADGPYALQFTGEQLAGTGPLTVALHDGGLLDLQAGADVTDTELGDLTVTGGTDVLNGSTLLVDGPINRDSGHVTTFSSTSVSLAIGTPFGPLTTSGSTIRMGSTGTTTVNGALTLDAATTLTFPARASLRRLHTAAGREFRQIWANSDAVLNDAMLDPVLNCDIRPGDELNFLKARNVTGLFTDTAGNELANGTTFLASPGSNCFSGRTEQVTIAYTRKLVTLTVVGVLTP